ncbi:MAG: hypothetical protein NC082_09735 [Clostridiales bacterium]|nr:hypothetical protein [Clostridiales bacterium]
MKHILYFSACVTSAVLVGVAFTSCNKDEVIESDRDHTVVKPQDPFDGVKVYEYMPAPGQFINENIELLTKESANEWAQNRINSNQFVSLGAFGGYIVMGLDHSILSRGSTYDFYVAGNAFLSGMGGSNEPGIVWVMQDTNGNHLPDDQWYELAGSDSFDQGTIRDFSITYYRPSAPGLDVTWQASDGSEGLVKYLPQFHKQGHYYPLWIDAGEYTLKGTLLSSKNSQNPNTGFWNNAPYEWGYADNVGSDALGGTPQRTGFRISNAIDGDGKKIQLDFIDFVKIQTAVLANSGILGEISTEVCGFGEYPIVE